MRTEFILRIFLVTLLVAVLAVATIIFLETDCNLELKCVFTKKIGDMLVHVAGALIAGLAINLFFWRSYVGIKPNELPLSGNDTKQYKNSLVLEVQPEASQAQKHQGNVVYDQSERGTHVDLREIMKSINFAQIEKIIVIANTGDSTLKTFFQFIRNSNFAGQLRAEVQILLCSPYACESSHVISVRRTAEEAKTLFMQFPDIRCEVRYYSCTPCLKCVLFEDRSRRFRGLTSFYDWDLVGRIKSTPYLFSEDASTAKAEPLSIYLSWFNHLWGKRRIHTLIFDFDDTLFFTADARVRAWLTSIRELIRTGRLRSEDLTAKLRNVVDDDRDAEIVLRAIVIQEQSEELVFRKIIAKEFDESLFNDLSAYRTPRREQLTLQLAVPIVSVLGDINRLKDTYQVVIVSEASEQLIKAVLRKHQITMFSHILGKEQWVPRWKEVENKTQNLIRLSSILGVPLDRMVFIGDSDTDYRSAMQLGIPFVENRFSAIRCGKVSLLRTPQGHLSIQGDQPEELIEAIETLETPREP